MKRGEVISRKDFKFSNGSITEKLLIVLNEAGPNRPHLLLFTTSKKWRRKDIPGCHSKDNYYVIPKDTDWFNSMTWVLFDLIIEYDFSKELQEHFQGKLITETILRENTIRSIINCLKLSEDVSPYQLSLLEAAEQEELVRIKSERKNEQP